MIAVVSSHDTSKGTMHNILLGLIGYWLDFFNVMELGAIFFFYLGLAARSGHVLDHSWHGYYSMSLFCCYIRILWVFSLTKLGIIVDIMLEMTKNVKEFILIHMMLVVAMSLLFYGLADGCGGDPFNAGNKRVCDTEKGYRFWFTRTLFQSFGDFFVEDGMLGEVSTNTINSTL